MLQKVYLDHNATTPIHPGLKAKVPEWLEQWGNPSSIHWAGRGPKTLLREARQSVAEFLGAEPLELIFTSGGTEANNQAIKSILDSGRALKGRDQIIISAVEHPSLRKAAEFMRERGFRLDIVNVNRDGQLDLNQLENLISERTALVSVMYANNETGHILPVREVVQMAHAKGAWVHCDAVQALGKAPLNLHELGVDLASFSAHKFYALKGCGVLYARKGTPVQSLIHGGGQERGRRAGTENILSIASLGYVCREGRTQIAPQAERLTELRDQLEQRILRDINDVQITGQNGLRLANTSNLTLKGIDGETLLMNLDVRGFAVSTGAACSSGSQQPSPVLIGMGLTRGEAQSSLRISLGWQTTAGELDAFADCLQSTVTRLRGFKHGAEFAYGV